MTAVYCLKALAKLDVIMVENTHGPGFYNRRFVGRINGHRIELNTQGEDISTLRVARATEQDDYQSDYFAGYYVDTIPQLRRAVGL